MKPLTRPKVTRPPLKPIPIHQIDESMKLLPAGFKGDQSVLTAKSLSLGLSLDHFIEGKANHLCIDNAGFYSQEVATSTAIVRNSKDFFSDPIKTIFSPDQNISSTESGLVHVQTSFSRANEKNLILDSVREKLEDQGRTGSLISDVCLTVDEFFTNAIFNAPFVDLVTGLNPGINRQDYSLSMPGRNHGELSLAFDSERVAVVCRDPFGTLAMQPFLKRLRECYVNGISNTIRHGSGGAGIGTFMVLQAASSFYVALNPGVETIFAATFNWMWSGKMRAKASKNIHCFAAEENQNESI